MAALVFLKSLSLFFHGVRHEDSIIQDSTSISSMHDTLCQVNYTKIAANGIHEESWAILYYVTHLLKVFAHMRQFLMKI